MISTEVKEVHEPASPLDNDALRARLEYGIWRETFEQAHAAWSLASNDLKPALLLTGQDLADAESWLLSSGASFTKSERQFVYKSVSQTSARRAQRRADAHDDATESERRTRHFILAMMAVILAVLGPGLLQFVVIGGVGEQLGRVLGASESHPPANVAAMRSAGIIARPAQHQAPAARPPRKLEPEPVQPTQHNEQSLIKLAQQKASAGDTRAANLLAIEAAESAARRGHLDSSAPGAASEPGAALSNSKAERIRLAGGSGWGQTGSTPVFCGAGKMLAASIDPETVVVWDATGSERLRIRNHRERLQAVSFDGTCGLAAIAGGEHSAQIWSLSNGKMVLELKGHETDIVSSAFSPDGRLLATGDQDRIAKIWDVASGRLLADLRGHEDSIEALAFSHDGRSLVTASRDKTARIWDVASGRQLAILGGHLGSVIGAEFDRNDHTLLTTSGDGSAIVWDVATRQKVFQLRPAKAGLLQAFFSPDGARIAGVSQANTVSLWAAGTGDLVATLAVNGDGVRAAEFSPDGRWIATLAWNGELRLWQSDSGRPATVLTHDDPGDKLLSVAFTQGGNGIAAVSAGGNALTWPVHSDRDAAIAAAKRSAPTCFSRAERAALGLDPEIPAWCSDYGKLPPSGSTPARKG